MREDEELDINATPIQICGGAIGQLADLWDELIERTGVRIGPFIEEVFGGIWRDGDTGEKFEAELKKWDEQPDDIKPLGVLQAAFICCAYACQAMKAQNNDDMLTAWRYTSRCSYWLGIVVGAWTRQSGRYDPKKEFALLGAAARHAENRAMKNDVFAWLDKNMTNQSMDSVALEIAGKVVPMKFRTVRDWITEWKKLRSAGTP